MRKLRNFHECLKEEILSTELDADSVDVTHAKNRREVSFTEAATDRTSFGKYRSPSFHARPSADGQDTSTTILNSIFRMMLEHERGLRCLQLMIGIEEVPCDGTQNVSCRYRSRCFIASTEYISFARYAVVAQFRSNESMVTSCLLPDAVLGTLFLLNMHHSVRCS